MMKNIPSRMPILIFIMLVSSFLNIYYYIKLF